MGYETIYRALKDTGFKEEPGKRSLSGDSGKNILYRVFNKDDIAIKVNTIVYSPTDKVLSFILDRNTRAKELFQIPMSYYFGHSVKSDSWEVDRCDAQGTYPNSDSLIEYLTAKNQVERVKLVVSRKNDPRYGSLSCETPQFSPKARIGYQNASDGSFSLCKGDDGTIPDILRDLEKRILEEIEKHKGRE